MLPNDLASSISRTLDGRPDLVFRAYGDGRQVGVSPHARGAIVAEMRRRGWPALAITRFFARYELRSQERLTQDDRDFFERAFRHRTKRAINSGAEVLPLRPRNGNWGW
jgi:hypothetical protein